MRGSIILERVARHVILLYSYSNEWQSHLVRLPPHMSKGLDQAPIWVIPTSAPPTSGLCLACFGFEV